MYGSADRISVEPGSINQIKAIRLVCHRENLLNSEEKPKDVVEIDFTLPGSKSLYSTLTNFIGCPLDSQNVEQIKKAIIQYYRKNYRPIVAVLQPKQELDSDILQLLVIEGVLGEISVEGNKHFSACKFTQYLGLESCSPIRSDRINKGLIVINRNPFRQADLIFKPGKEPGTTDIDLIVNDIRPFRVYSGIDNTGNNATGNNRLYLGLNWGNAFGLDHLFSFQFTASDDFRRFLGYVASYSFPLPFCHIVSVYGGYSTVDSKFKILEEADHFRNTGYNAQASFRYNIPFNPLYSFLQEIASGLDFKRTNNNLEFGGAPVFSKNVNLFQWMLSYNFGYQDKKWVTTFEFETFFSPFRWLPDQSNATYETLRPKAKCQYIYCRSSFSAIRHFDPWLQLNLFIRGQASSANLLPSEEYGMGGYDTVRGYQEREANGDNALNTNFDISSHPFALSRLLGYKNGKDRMQVLAFFDFGLASIHERSRGQKKNQYLYSAGPGLRYQIQTHLNARLDWGIQLHHITPQTPHQRLHFQFIGSF